MMMAMAAPKDAPKEERVRSVLSNFHPYNTYLIDATPSPGPDKKA